MREKRCGISVPVFAFASLLLFGFLMLTTSPAFAETWYKGKGKHKEWQEERKFDKEVRKHSKEQDIHARRDYRERRDYRKYRGYRERPYDKHRHYGHYYYRGHRYDYFQCFPGICLPRSTPLGCKI